MLTVTRQVWLEMLAESWRVYPEEACGLLLASGTSDSVVIRFLPVANAARSSRIFQLDPMGHMKAERVADESGLEVVGVMHSHTHTAAYPSATDLAEARNPLVPPTWHWAIISLAWGEPELRSFSLEPAPIGGGPGGIGRTESGIAEESVALAR